MAGNLLNPVLKGTLTLPAKEKDAQKRTNIRLSMPEDFALTKWLHTHDFQPGESIADLVRLARIDTKVEKINYNHIQTRLVEFDLKLIPLPTAPKEVAKIGERLLRLECAVCAIIREQNRMLRDFGQEPAAEVLKFLEQVDTD